MKKGTLKIGDKVEVQTMYRIRTYKVVETGKEYWGGVLYIKSKDSFSKTVHYIEYN